MLFLNFLADWNFVENIQKPNIIIAFILALSSFIVMIFANKITDALFKSKTDEQKLKIVFGIKIGCAVVCLIALIISMIW